MNKWIFQGKPERYDIAKKLMEGARETWLASRYAKDMRVGDVVYFWRSGDEANRGIYGWGVIDGIPEQHRGWGWGVPVKYVRRFPQPIRAADLRHRPVFKNHLIFRMPVGTNFSLSPEEAADLETAVSEQVGPGLLPKGGAK